jgi:hypothetical protein
MLGHMWRRKVAWNRKFCKGSDNIERAKILEVYMNQMQINPMFWGSLWTSYYKFVSLCEQVSCDEELSRWNFQNEYTFCQEIIVKEFFNYWPLY